MCERYCTRSTMKVYRKYRTVFDIRSNVNTVYTFRSYLVLFVLNSLLVFTDKFV